MPNLIAEGSGKRSDARSGAWVFANLKRGIFENTHQAGTYLLECDLAAELGVSRTPIRETMVKLEAEGPVENSNRRAIRALPKGACDMRDIYDSLCLWRRCPLPNLRRVVPPVKDCASLGAFEAKDAKVAYQSVHRHRSRGGSCIVQIP